MEYRTTSSDASVFLWPDEAAGPWQVRLSWREVAGRPECVGFAVEEWELADPAEPHIVTRQMVRAVPVGTLIEEARRREAGAAEIVAGLYIEEGEHGEAFDQLAYAERLRPRAQESGGRPRMYGREHYREVANVYFQAWRNGEPPTKAVQEFFGVSYSTAARWVREARKRDELSKAPEAGVPGGLPRWIEPDTKEEVS